MSSIVDILKTDYYIHICNVSTKLSDFTNDLIFWGWGWGLGCDRDYIIRYAIECDRREIVVLLLRDLDWAGLEYAFEYVVCAYRWGRWEMVRVILGAVRWMNLVNVENKLRMRWEIVCGMCGGYGYGECRDVVGNLGFGDEIEFIEFGEAIVKIGLEESFRVGNLETFKLCVPYLVHLESEWVEYFVEKVLRGRRIEMVGVLVGGNELGVEYGGMGENIWEKIKWCGCIVRMLEDWRDCNRDDDYNRRVLLCLVEMIDLRNIFFERCKFNCGHDCLRRIVSMLGCGTGMGAGEIMRVLFRRMMFFCDMDVVINYVKIGIESSASGGCIDVLNVVVEFAREIRMGNICWDEVGNHACNVKVLRRVIEWSIEDGKRCEWNRLYRRHSCGKFMLWRDETHLVRMCAASFDKVRFLLGLPDADLSYALEVERERKRIEEGNAYAHACNMIKILENMRPSALHVITNLR